MYNYYQQQNINEIPKRAEYHNRVQNNLDEINEMYPEIYNLVYPIVAKTVETVDTRTLSKELIEKYTNEIYIKVESEQKYNNQYGKREETRNLTIDTYLQAVIKIIFITEIKRKTRSTKRV